MDGGLVLTWIDVGARELALFACVGLLIGGVDDLLIDLIWLFGPRRDRPIELGDRHRFAVFVPAWQEASVIGPMLRNALSMLTHPDYRIYVGVYANDPATVRAAARVAAGEPRIRIIVNPRAGPTTKGDNLNALWRALLRDAAADGWVADAVVLHDAEDVVDPSELGVFDRLLAEFAVIQLPVMPLIVPHSRWVSAHYADEFAIAHERTLSVRQRLGTGLPLAGVGCAIRRDTLAALAERHGGEPFDPNSLTEDYELGLTLSQSGARTCFARVSGPDERLVSVRAYFPATMPAAARQKARWIAGIALLGWDRIGWGRSRNPFEYWMRMRDRRGPLAMAVLAAAYLAMLCGGISAMLHLILAAPAPAVPGNIALLVTINSALMLWRMAVRGWTTRQIYGWREGLRALPRMVVGNFIALMAMWRALAIYWQALRGIAPRWDKTAHIFPARAGI